MLGIIIGVSAVISLLSIGQGVEKFINSQFNALGTNLLFVLPKLSNSQGAQFVAQFANQTTLTQSDARALGDPGAGAGHRQRLGADPAQCAGALCAMPS